MALVFPLLILALMYFMVIAPQRKRLRAQQALHAALGPGDRVLTIGGLYGTLVGLDDDVALLSVAPGVELQVARGAISRRVDPVVAGGADGAADPEARS